MTLALSLYLPKKEVRIKIHLYSCFSIYTGMYMKIDNLKIEVWSRKKTMGIFLFSIETIYRASQRNCPKANWGIFKYLTAIYFNRVFTFHVAVADQIFSNVIVIVIVCMKS